MPAFEFRLQRVLDYRELQEGWAKDAVLAARASRIQAEAVLSRLEITKEAALAPQDSVTRLVELDAYIARIDDEIESQRNVIDILSVEEEKARSEWSDARVALKSLQKLRERAEVEWRAEVAAAEQGELDEWTHAKREAS